MPECVERWAQAPTKAHRESVLSLPLWLLLLHSSTTCSLVSYSSGSVFCSFAGGGNKALHQHRHSCTFTVCHSPYLSNNTNPTWMLSANILTCACAVGRAKGIFISLLFAFFSFFLFIFNLNTVCSGPHLRDFLTPFQKLMSLLSLSCN